MKSRLFVLLALIISASGVAQTDEVFRVITVSGVVEHIKLKRALEQGDKIHAGDPLKFSSKNDYVIVINAKVGRKTIRGVPDSSPRELKHLLESFLLASEKSTSTRGLDTEYWAVLHETLKDTLVILGDGLIPLNKKYINLTKPSVITATFKNKKSTHVNKVVSVGQNLCLSKSCLFGEGTPDFATKILVEYYDNEANSRDLPGSGEFIGYFWPRYLNEAELEKEVRVITEVLKDSHRAEIIREVKRHLIVQYGQVEENNLVAWLHAHKLIAQ